MNLRNTTILATAILLPALGLAQAIQRPPVPPVPPAAPPPQGTAAPSQGQGLLEPPPGLENKARPIVQMESYDQWAKKYYKVFTIPKKDAIPLGKNRVRPMRLINVVLEIVGEKGDDYLVRNLPPEDPQAVGHDTWWRNEGTEIFMRMKNDYFKDKYLIVDNPDVPPPFVDKVRFALRDQGLPHGGRWQMSFDIADMNGDGLPDLVFGPQRTGEEATGYIFLQQKDHSWQLWRDTKWPTRGLKLDYGTVRVADFDGDGNKDIAIACHFSKTYVLYGNGKGDFTRFVTVPQTNQGMTSRALTVGDFNGDGRPDIATYAEVDLDMGSTSRITSGLVNVALNLPSGWKAVAKDFFPEGIQGDWLTAADVLGVGSDQILLTSRAQNVMDLVFRNGGGGEKWDSTARLSFPVNAYVLANAVGPLDRFKQPDLLECFEQFNPWKVEPPTQACVIYRFHDAQGRPLLTPDRTVLFQEKVEYQNYQAAAIGDIDGDGRNDIVVATSTGKVRVFLQGADGQFYEQMTPGMDRPGTVYFDVKIADLYGDGKGEIVLAGSPAKEQGGGVWVYQPLPVRPVAP
ncbi:MAG: VCBS repeat-containing protein [Thermoanaerobaculaceae bacterium]|nr:VCBS repeat-containing protein [Thermoanaerobaculaceae bacterium]TAM49012.1 MAG: VCBS repeat-containing protein [Acidobacteriota bacterium]